MFWIFGHKARGSLALTRMEPAPTPEGGVSTAGPPGEPSEPSFLSFRAHPVFQLPGCFSHPVLGADSKFSLFPSSSGFDNCKLPEQKLHSTLTPLFCYLSKKKQPRLRQRKDLHHNHQLHTSGGTRKRRQTSLANARGWNLVTVRKRCGRLGRRKEKTTHSPRRELGFLAPSCHRHLPKQKGCWPACLPPYELRSTQLPIGCGWRVAASSPHKLESI